MGEIDKGKASSWGGLVFQKSAKEVVWVRSKGTAVMDHAAGDDLPKQRAVSR